MDNLQFIRIISNNPVFNTLIERLPELELKDVWIASGALFQTAWNHLTGRDPEYGIKDYDIVYYDASDLSWEAEDRVIANAAEMFKDLDADLEVKNQARVPLWYPEKFGKPYPPLEHSRKFINRFLATVCVIGIQPKKDRINLHAPYGFVDVSNMYIRPNLTSTFQPGIYLNKMNRWKESWPELQTDDQGKKVYLKYCHDGDT